MSSLPQKAPRLFPIFAFAAISVIACHVRAADSPPINTAPGGPTVDIEIDDRGPEKTSVHIAKLTVFLVEGRAKLAARDGEARYELSANIPPANGRHVFLSLSRGQSDKALDLNIESAIAAEAKGRVIVAKIDRADGRTTIVTAQFH